MTFNKRSAFDASNFSHLFKIAFLFCISFFGLQFSAHAQDDAGIDEAAWEAGRTLFRGQCAACHHPVNPMTGPALSGALDRWEADGEYDGISGKEWFYRWVRNNNEVLAAGHTYANNLYNEWDKSPMNLFPALTNEEIDQIVLYVDNHEYGKAAAQADVAAPTEAPSTFPMKAFLAILVLGLLAIVLILMRVSKGLKNIAREQQGLPIEPSVPFWKNPRFGTLIVLAGVILLGYFTASNAIALGRQEGYAPQQPIKYSHELHAGVYSIECQYCHSGASESKHSNIPSINVCMNCHKNINEGPQHGRKEIAKIYAAIGYNPNEAKYFNTDEVSEDDVAAELKEYLAKDYEEGMAAGDEEMLNASLEAAMAMYNRPVEWVRIHNLPDHVYFNHAQHVNAGNVECQTCHGNIQEMEVVAQHAPLSMGWCINCHRQTEVDLGNEYYAVYEKYHEDLKSGAMDKVTVEDIGGTECQKCHY